MTKTEKRVMDVLARGGELFEVPSCRSMQLYDPADPTKTMWVRPNSVAALKQAGLLVWNGSHLKLTVKGQTL